MASFVIHNIVGENVTDTEINDAILLKMKNCNNKDRNAKVVCNLVYYDSVNAILGEGILYGRISKEKRGKNGFGFDEIFELQSNRTLAELTSEEKNNISARYLVAVDLKRKLRIK